jgi:hypothetical protein
VDRAQKIRLASQTSEITAYKKISNWLHIIYAPTGEEKYNSLSSFL